MHPLLRPLARLANSLLLHPNGAWKADKAASMGCQCGQIRPTNQVTIHRETTTGRIHYHCPSCGAINVVALFQQLRRLSRSLAPLCAATPPRGTRAWYVWNPEWRRSYFNMSEVWRRKDDPEIYVLMPQSDDTVRAMPAPESVRLAYQASREVLKAARGLADEAAKLGRLEH